MKKLSLLLTALTLLALAQINPLAAAYCSASIVCPSPPWQPWQVSCFTWTGNCNTGSYYVACGNTYYTCEMCERGQIPCLLPRD